MRIVNVNVPPWYPTQPYLSVPLLTGILRDKGYYVYQKDLNLAFYDKLLSKNEIEYQYKTYVNAGIKKVEHKQQLLINLKSFLIDNIESFKSQTRQYVQFTNESNVSNIFQNLELALKIYTLNYPDVEISLGEIKYNFDFLDIDILEKYIFVERNLFRYYFEKYELHDILNQKPDVVGIGITTPEQLIPALILSNLIKRNSNTKVLWGGDYIFRVFKILAKNTLLNELFDFILLGQAEKSIIDLFTTLTTGTDLSKVPSLVWKMDDEVVVNETKVGFDYQNIPFPDFDGLNLNGYFFPTSYLPIEVSKGCFWGKCEFCEIKGKQYKQKNAIQVADEMKYQNSRYGNLFYSFVSSSPSPKLLYDVSQQIKHNNFKWSAFIRPEKYIDDDFAKILYEGGCRIVFIGIESGSQNVLDLMNKGSVVEETIRVLQSINKAGIKIHGYFMFGFPRETEMDREQTVAFINKHKDLFNTISFSSYVEPISLCILNNLKIYKSQFEDNSYMDFVNKIDNIEEKYSYNLNLEIIYGS